MIKNNVLKERLITVKELNNISENRKRVFRVNYSTMGGIMRSNKWFQDKRYVRNFIGNPKITNVKIYVGDVVNEPKI